jgi:hypothetical protein
VSYPEEAFSDSSMRQYHLEKNNGFRIPQKVPKRLVRLRIIGRNHGVTFWLEEDASLHVNSINVISVLTRAGIKTF